MFLDALHHLLSLWIQSLFDVVLDRRAKYGHACALVRVLSWKIDVDQSSASSWSTRILKMKHWLNIVIDSGRFINWCWLAQSLKVIKTNQFLPFSSVEHRLKSPIVFVWITFKSIWAFSRASLLFIQQKQWKYGVLSWSNKKNYSYFKLRIFLYLKCVRYTRYN